MSTRIKKAGRIKFPPTTDLGKDIVRTMAKAMVEVSKETYGFVDEERLLWEIDHPLFLENLRKAVCSPPIRHSDKSPTAMFGMSRGEIR